MNRKASRCYDLVPYSLPAPPAFTRWISLFSLLPQPVPSWNKVDRGGKEDERESVIQRGVQAGVVEKISRGEYKSLSEASRKNGIQGSETVGRWIKHYGREDLLPKRIKVETMEEIDELKAARKRIRELEAALADAYIDWLLERSFLDIACERLGTTMEELKKKNAVSLADRRKQRGRL